MKVLFVINSSSPFAELKHIISTYTKTILQKINAELKVIKLNIKFFFVLGRIFRAADKELSMTDRRTKLVTETASLF